MPEAVDSRDMRPSSDIDPIDELLEAGAFDLREEWSSPPDRFLLGVRGHAFSLYALAGAFHFDLEGRLRRASLPSGPGGRIVHYLRGLDGKVLRKARAGGAATLAPPSTSERVEVFERAHEAAARALESFPRDAEPAALDFLERAAAYDPERLEAEAARFLEAYAPLGVLPPDAYACLILQETEGCRYDGCTFCTLYKGRPYRAKSPADLREHARRVKAFLGRALPLRKGVFLGEASSLGLPHEALLEVLEVARGELPEAAARGFSAFQDALTGPGRTVEEHRELARRGLRRVHLGVESGDEGLLRFLEKPTSRAGMLARVAGLKGAGISASVILLVGAGGRAFAEAHLERSLDLVASMGLGPGDIVYLSPLAAGPDTEYARRLREEGIEPLAEPELLAEEARLRRGLAAVLGPRGAKVARYDLRSFVYY